VLAVVVAASALAGGRVVSVQVMGVVLIGSVSVGEDANVVTATEAEQVVTWPVGETAVPVKVVSPVMAFVVVVPDTAGLTAPMS
jgi:hypothetical protein